MPNRNSRVLVGPIDYRTLNGHPRCHPSVRALDRALLSGDYVIPLYHLQKQWVAYWRHLGQPEQTSLFGYQVDTWWSATIEKAQTVERTRN